MTLTILRFIYVKVIYERRTAEIWEEVKVRIKSTFFLNLEEYRSQGIRNEYFADDVRPTRGNSLFLNIRYS